MHVEMGLLLEISLDRDGAAVDIVHHQHLLDWHRLAGDEAWPEVDSCGTELDAWLSCATYQLEVVLRPTNNLELELVILEMVLSNRKVSDLELDLFAFWNATSLRSDSDVLVDLSLPYEIEVELSTIAHYNSLGLLLVDKEISVLKFVRLTSTHFNSA